MWNRKTTLFLIIAIGVLFAVNQFTTVLDFMLSGTQYANVVSDYTTYGDDGTNPLRVLVYSVPALLSLFFKNNIRELGDRRINFAANMSIVSAGMYVVSMVTSGILLGRIPIYFSLYGYILLPWIIKNCFTESSRRIMNVLMVVFYMMFYYYQMHFAWGYM